MLYGILFAITMLAGLVQGVTGFGSCIVIMLVLPFYFPLAEAAGIAVATTLIMGVVMILRYRTSINVREALLPSLLYIIVSSLAIHFSASVDQTLMKKVFGVFLVLLSEFYLGFVPANSNQKKLPLLAGAACIILSAACDGLFGIGGPLMVIYFMHRTTDLHEYLGTLQLFFLVNNVYNTGFRFFRGVLGPQHLIFIAVGMAGILIGVLIAGKIVEKVRRDVLRKLIYVMIGIGGLVNLL
ncbi:MAG: sulfite exporter TauE/SafE family protein [Firmicutes bacterium]|nr:sulfite exporter TauE/SafE family protein [Bacillota bacterium]